jgi:hypothetical protein
MTKKEKKVLSTTGKVANEDGKLKIVFEPGCFDHIDVVNQEELDAIIAEIQNMFAIMTPEELQAQSRPLTDEDIEEMDEDEREIILKALAHAQDQEARKNRLN